MTRLTLILAGAISISGGAAVPLGQAPAAPQRPSFAGTWIPADPAKSDVFFDNGLGWVPGNGRVVIEHRPNRLTITKHIPDDKLDALLAIHGRWELTTAFPILQPIGRAGGAGAGGAGAGGIRGVTSWEGERLVLARSGDSVRQVTVSLSFDAERLKVDTHTVIVGAGRQSTVTELFTRAK